MLAAFTVLPRVHLSNGNDSLVDISYIDAIFEKNTVTLRVDYEKYGENFEIAKDISVATDKEFSNQLRMSNCVVDEDTGIYTYEFALSSYKEKIYIEPPILYVPTTTSTATAELDSGSTVYMAEGNEWFTVSSVKVDNLSDDFYTVTVMITPSPNTTLLPRFPKLVCGNNRFGGLSSINFNQNNEFDFGEFVFFVNASSIKEVSTMVADASIEINQALEKVSVELSSNIKTLSVKTK